MSNRITLQCITANLRALHDRLVEADMLVWEDLTATAAGKRNLAIGTVLPLERSLPECDAILRTVLLIHRSEPLAVPTPDTPLAWEDAFDKFGFEDGDGQVMTDAVAATLREAGYRVTAAPWGMHNVVITAIGRDGTSLIPADIRLGYDDPRQYLPTDIVALLDATYPRTRKDTQ